MNIEKPTDPEQSEIQKHNRQKAVRKRRCCIALISVLLLFLTLFIIILILAFTVFKPKDPKTEVLSTKIDGISPRVSFPALKIELNITVDLEILVHNPNRASFKHGQGQSLVFYRDNQIGEVDIFPGRIPARGSETLKSRLTLEADKFGSDLSRLISDVLAGEMVIETKTRVPGRVTFLGFIKKHAVALSNCQITIGFPDLKVRQQQCKNKTKL
ncbi:Late embryogenesis abundant protein [Macleaya cordata]|uniref:Late embryogenesis abundant protein n=1 Tax=Macleaya cordata TaxID=56857 RepID=A0A200PN59_MACCD|nr:Late embryogenesis abundant protein [Macleaya cordata]